VIDDEPVSPAKPQVLENNTQKITALQNAEGVKPVSYFQKSMISGALPKLPNPAVSPHPVRLQAQLEELSLLYCTEKTLACLGMKAGASTFPYDSIAKTLLQLLTVQQGHLLQVEEDNREGKNPDAERPSNAKRLSVIGSSHPETLIEEAETTILPHSYPILRDALSGQLNAEISQPFPCQEDTLPKILWQPVNRQRPNPQNPVALVLPFQVRSDIRSDVQGLFLVVAENTSVFTPSAQTLLRSVGKVFETGLSLQYQLDAMVPLMEAFPKHHKKLDGLRNTLTEQMMNLGVAQQQFVESLSFCVDDRYTFTQGTSRAVAQIARRIAEAMALNEKTVDLVYRAGLLGALGRVSVSEALMNKRGKLTEQEKQQLQTKPDLGLSLLNHVPFLGEVIPYVTAQSEHWNGTGSPEQLSGYSIPLGARILAVAHAYYAMTQERPYRAQPMTRDHALKILQAEAGQQWDPLIVSVLFQVV
jgi:HD-GYP domain-containing protein (c-di-GMP phosphodiesterase class II)